MVDDEDDGSNGEEELALDQSEEEESSTIASEMDEGKEESTFDFQWGEPLDEEQVKVVATQDTQTKRAGAEI